MLCLSIMKLQKQSAKNLTSFKKKSSKENSRCNTIIHYDET